MRLTVDLMFFLILFLSCTSLNRFQTTIQNGLTFHRIKSFMKSTQIDGDKLNTLLNTNSTYSFAIYGEPKPLSRHMISNGRMYNPSSKFQKDFLTQSLPYLPPQPIEGPLKMSLIFYFSRPKSHYRTGKFQHILRDDAPHYHNGRKDLDNLIKFVLDSFNKVAYLDDSQVCIIHSSKYYTSEQARVEVILEPILCNLSPILNDD